MLNFTRATKILAEGLTAYTNNVETRPLSYRIWNQAGKFPGKSDGAYSFVYEYFKYFPDIEDDDTPSDSDMANMLNFVHEAVEAWAIARGFERLGAYDKAEFWQNNDPMRQRLGRFEQLALQLVKRDKDRLVQGVKFQTAFPG